MLCEKIIGIVNIVIVCAARRNQDKPGKAKRNRKPKMKSERAPGFCNHIYNLYEHETENDNEHETGSRQRERERTR